MSATPNNAGVGWDSSSPNANQPGSAQNGESGRNALQALLAFACIHEQAKRKRLTSQTDSAPNQEDFALDEVLQLVAARAISITGADGVAIALVQDDAIVCRASFGSIAPDRGTKLDPKSGFSGACLRRGETVRCDDSETDSRVNAQACRSLGTRSMVAVPLSTKNRVVGLVEAFSTETFGFNDSDVRSLNLLGELILAAIRPEEEDRLAELAKQIIPDRSSEPAPANGEIQAQAVIPPKILVDEKFAPAPSSQLELLAEPIKSSTPLSATPLSVVAEKTAAVVEKTEHVKEQENILPSSESEFEPSPAHGPPRFKRIASIALTTAAILAAIGLLWPLVWKWRHAEQAISANTRPPMEAKSEDVGAQEIIPPPIPSAKPGPTPEVTGIRHWSNNNTSTVVVDLEDQIEYEAHSLDNPPRIYFDLHDTKMAPGLANQSIELNDPFLKRIRMAQPVNGVTRIVLETKKEAEFSFKLEPNPYRFTIEVRKPADAAGLKVGPTSETTTPATKPSPAIAVSPKKGAEAIKPQFAPGAFQVVLDAGHGGWDLGAVGRKGLLEKDLTLDVVQRLGKLIESKLGGQVIYTRQDDSYLPLEKRAEIANLAKANLFLSVHANYSDLATARGVEAYYSNTYSSIKARSSDDPSLKEIDWTGVDIRAKVTDSHRLAADVQQALYGALVARNPEIRNRGVKEAQYVVLTGTQMPAILAEISFVSSPQDEGQLQNSEYRQQIAEALFKGVAKYRDELKHVKLAQAKQ